MAYILSTDLVCQLDYEHYNSRVDSAQRKETRSVREENALVKHEGDLARSNAVSDYMSVCDQMLAHKISRSTKLPMSSSEGSCPLSWMAYQPSSHICSQYRS
jgi:hypothetical protein